jgi:hypothetical protein
MVASVMRSAFLKRCGVKRARTGGFMSLAEYPGFASFSPDLQALLLQAEAGDHAQRPELLERVAEALGVLIGLDLLQFVFIPPERPDGAKTGAIDLIAPPENDTSIAWFSVDEAGHDEFRDAVTLLGDLTELLNPPIVLDVDSGVSDEL